jgi:hypothetical protein
MSANKGAQFVSMGIPTDFYFCLSTVVCPAKEFFHLYGDLTIAGEGLQNLGLCSAPRTFEQGKDVYCATPTVTRDLGFTSLIASYNIQGDVEDLF